MPDLPRGTVTFLFTDLEGSVSLWDRDRAAMGRAIERHFAFLWEVIGRYVGTRFMAVGDGGTLSFPGCRRRWPRRDIAAKERMGDGWGSI
jgi:class 3 adenylate cyclase